MENIAAVYAPYSVIAVRASVIFCDRATWAVALFIVTRTFHVGFCNTYDTTWWNRPKIMVERCGGNHWWRNWLAATPGHQAIRPIHNWHLLHRLSVVIV